MRVYFNSVKEVLVVEGTKTNFPPKSLSTSYEGDKVSIWAADQVSRIVFTNFINIQTEQNGTFQTPQEAVAYLNEEFAKSGSSNFDGGFF